MGETCPYIYTLDARPTGSDIHTVETVHDIRTWHISSEPSPGVGLVYCMQRSPRCAMDVDTWHSELRGEGSRLSGRS